MNYWKIKSIIYELALVLIVTLAAMSQIGCMSYHTGIALGKDLGEWGASVSDHYTEKQNKMEHGRHYEHYKPMIRNSVRKWLAGE